MHPRNIRGEILLVPRCVVDILFGMNISTRCEVRTCAALGGLFLASLAASATPVSLSNPSFELPATGFVDTRVDGWAKTPAPVWFDPVLAGGASWDQVSGVFANPPVGQATRKTNIDGNQALYLFALPTAAQWDPSAGFALAPRMSALRSGRLNQARTVTFPAGIGSRLLFLIATS